MATLKRQLGLVGSMAIGISAMLGAGVFYVWAPAYERAGSWLLVALGIAGVVATLNGLSTTQLAIRQPVSGGIYSYGRHYLGDYPGFLAGWLFLTGKIGSAAAIAYVAASYLAPDVAKPIAVASIAVMSLLVTSGIRIAAKVSIVISSLVVIGLMWLALPRQVSAEPIAFGSDGSVMGVLSAAGLIFFAFAGYARMATLGEEVVKPTRVLPRAIIGGLWVVFVIYLVVAFAVMPELDKSDSGLASPLIVLAPTTPWLVIALASIASLGSLMAILAGLSRTSLAMARNSDLPRVLSRVSPRLGGPLVAEIAVAIGAIALVVFTNPLWLVGLSSAGVLTYYAIGHLSALRQPSSERIVWRIVPALGLGLCALLVVTLPWQSLLAAVVSTAVGSLWFVIRRATTNN